MQCKLIILLLIFSPMAWAIEDDLHLQSSRSGIDIELKNKPTQYSVTILTDPSLTVPITLIAREYSRLKSISVSVEFSSNKDQVKKIIDGAEAHIFITPKISWISKLQRKGLIDVHSHTNIAHNRMVLANAKPANILQKKWYKYLNMNDREMKLAIADPEYFAEGTYSMQAIVKDNLMNDIEEHLLFFRNMFLLMQSVSHYGNYGIMFETDAILNPKINIIKILPSNSHTSITYRGVVVVGENMNEARNFLKFLNSENSVKIFKKFGFLEAI